MNERQRARAVFKQLKAGLKSKEQVTADEIVLLKRYYPFLF